VTFVAAGTPVASDHDFSAGDCQAMQAMLEIVGRRWTAAVLLAGARGARRFGEYRKLIPGISDRLLSQRLKELEAIELLSREVVPTTPVQILYRPSEKGLELVAGLRPLVGWAARHLPKQS
jgi:DNA-binding HxlR family transcriptional regulator